MKKLVIQLALFTMSFLSCYSQTANDNLGVPGPIVYENIEYNLAWSAIPAKHYYKQEYLAAGSDTKHFKNMLLLEAVEGDFTILDIIKIKLEELKERQKKDPVVNFKLFNNPDQSEYVLDFIVSEGKQRISTVEWDAYRYKLFVDSSGHKGVQLFGVCIRETEDVTSFLNSLKDIRKKEITAIEEFSIPFIQTRN